MRQILNRMQSNEAIATVHYVVRCINVQWAVHIVLVRYMRLTLVQPILN